MTCPNCAAAANTLHHGFTAACKDCCARAAARSPHSRRVRDAGMLDGPYRMLLAQFDLTHEQVKAAAQADHLTSGRWREGVAR